MQISDRIRSELAPAEQVLWSGQPRRGVTFRVPDAPNALFGLFAAVFAVDWLHKVAQSGASPSFYFAGVLMLLIGSYFAVGHFVVEARQRAATFYALTPQRVIICSGLVSKSVKSLPLKAIQEVSLSEWSNGTGTITFGTQSTTAGIIERISGWSNAGRNPGPRFERVPQAREVYELVRKAQARAT
jgi:hypothetical protein